MGTPASRRARRSADDGDHERAVTLVAERLRASLPAKAVRTLRRARSRRAPASWDLEYRDASGERVAILVRASRTALFEAVDVSAAEWDAARRLGTRYWLFLVAGLMSNPRISRVQNPAGQVQDRTIDAVPTGWRLTWPAGTP